MKLIPLGTSGAYPRAGSACSSYLVKTDKNMLFDIGSGALSRIEEFCEIKDIDGVFLTHYHFDHISDLFVLRHHFCFENKTLKIFAPKSNCLEAGSIDGYAEYELIGVEVGDVIKLGKTIIEVVRADHVGACVGYRVSNGGALYISGDTRYGEWVEDNVKKSDLSVLDTFKPEMDMTVRTPHMSFERVLKLKDQTAAKILCAHVHPTAYESAKAALGEMLAKEKTVYDI